MASTGEPARRKRILIIVENLPVPFDRRVWQEATTLAAHGYDVSVICPTGRGYERRREVLEGIHVFRHPLPREAPGAAHYLAEYGAALYWQFRLATRVFRTHGFDVIHACNPPDAIFLVGAVFKLLFGTRFVFDHHDLCPELYEAKFERRDWLYRVMLLLERLTFSLADMSLAANASYRQIAIERGGMAPQDVVIVRSGPDLGRLRLVPEDPALRCGRRWLVGYVGVMGKQEGIAYLIDAAHHIVHRLNRADVHFGLVGDGPERESLKAYAAARGVADHMTFTGRVPDAALLTMVSTADVCVNPDTVNPMNDKSTMNKIMEYMALGKPIVQFDVAEGRFSAQEASLYARANDPVDLARRLLELIDDPVRRERMGAYGRRRVETVLAWHHQEPALVSAYERLLGPPEPVAARGGSAARSAPATEPLEPRLRSRKV